MAIDFRALTQAEQPKALALWQEVFQTAPGFFERYYNPEADPWHVEGDTFGAWDGDRLVSAVHLCRRPAAWGDRTLLCGAIANVATLPDYRRRGLSAELLKMAIRRMEHDGFDYSLLGTGVPSHYSALGWQQVEAPTVTIRPASAVALRQLSVRPLAAVDDLASVYKKSPRPLQFARPAGYFENWAGWSFRQGEPLLMLLPDHGYVLMNRPAESDSATSVVEYRADSEDAERRLIEAALCTVPEGSGSLELGAVPQFISLDFLERYGQVSVNYDSSSMVRNISLDQEIFHSILNAYQSGQAKWWSGDGF